MDARRVARETLAKELEAGLVDKELAVHYKVAACTVSQIVNNKTWREST